MKITIDKYASYVYLKEIGKGQVASTIEIGDGLYADYDDDGRLLGIEFLGTPEIVHFDSEDEVDGNR